MKTMIDIHSEARPVASGYRMPDCSKGDPSDEDPLAAYTWRDLSKMIYEPGRTYKHPGAR